MGTRFSAPVQTSPVSHPTSYTMGTGSFQGVKRPGRGVDHPSPSSTDVKERVELYLFPLWAFVACSKVTFTFIFAFRPSGIMQFLMTGNPAWLRGISAHEPTVTLEQLVSICLLPPDVYVSRK